MVTQKRPSYRPIDSGDPAYRIVPAGLCGYCLSMDPPRYCGKPEAYRFRLVGWRNNQVGGACVEHAAIVRRKPDVEWIRTARPIAR